MILYTTRVYNTLYTLIASALGRSAHTCHWPGAYTASVPRLSNELNIIHRHTTAKVTVVLYNSTQVLRFCLLATYKYLLQVGVYPQLFWGIIPQRSGHHGWSFLALKAATVAIRGHDQTPVVGVSSTYLAMAQLTVPAELTTRQKWYARYPLATMYDTRQHVVCTERFSSVGFDLFICDPQSPSMFYLRIILRALSCESG